MGAIDADEVLLESLSRANKLLDDATPAELLTVLEEADADLKKRLGAMSKAAGPDMRFSEAQAMAYQKQIDVTTRYVKKRLLGMTHAKAKSSIYNAVKSTTEDIAKLNEAFSGVATPLRLREAAVQAGITSQAQAALLPQQATSVDRYGDGMIQDFRKIMRRGAITGVSNSQMVDALVGHGGPKGPKVSTSARKDPVTGKVIRLREENIPEGLFVRKRYWAKRVVRTEVAHGQNEARLRTIERSQQTDFPDMGKKILAMMDMRTAMDSIGVHGQIRPPEGLFQDGAGRQYLRPPARPNDRETIVPWRASWDETPYSSPMPPKDVAELQAGNMAPGKAKQAAIRQAQEGYEAALDAKSKKAMTRVHKLIGTKLGGQIGPAIAAQNVTELKAAQATAKAQQKAAIEKAKVTMEKAEATAAAQAQKAATAQATAVAKVKEQAKIAQAKAAEYKKKVAAEAKAKLVKVAKAKIKAVKAKGKKAVGVGNNAPVLKILEDLAKADPVAFAEVYSQVIKGGAPVPPKFFQGLGKTFKVQSKSVAKKLGAWIPEPPKPVAPPPPPPPPPKAAPKKAPKKKTGAWSKPYPEPNPAFDTSPYTFKLEGGKWNDIYKGKTKKGFVLKVDNQWVADPPQYLKDEGWEKLTWPANAKNLPAAADYSLKLSDKIAATKTQANKAKAAAQKAENKASAALAAAERKAGDKFAPKVAPETVLGELPVDAATKKQVAAARKWAEKWDKPGKISKLRSKNQSLVDVYIDATGDADIKSLHRKWSDGWYGSSQGARNTVGNILEGKGVTTKNLKSIAKDIGYRGPVEKIPEFVRRKYAGTQAVLELRDKKDQSQREWMFLSRGVNGTLATNIKRARLKGKSKVALHSVSSWSSKRSVARAFAGGGGVVLRAGVHRSRVFSQFEQEHKAMSAYGDSESEYIVISRGGAEEFHPGDLEDSVPPKFSESAASATSQKSAVYKSWKKKVSG